MKFGKQLRSRVDESYEAWRPMFMNYKILKKCIQPQPNSPHADTASVNALNTSPDNEHNSQSNDSENDSEQTLPKSNIADTPLLDHHARGDHIRFHHTQTMHADHAVRHAELHHAQFFAIFRREVDKVNDFFLDKQEDFVIEHAQLSSKVDAFLQPGCPPTRYQCYRLKERLISFHGELVLLESFSTVNYTGFRKILKKFDKKTALLIRDVYLPTVLYTPFFASDTVRNLIRKTEYQLNQLTHVTKFRRASPPPVSPSKVVHPCSNLDSQLVPSPTTNSQ